MVVFDNNIIGRVYNYEEAEATLKKLSGNEHKIVCALGLYNSKEKNTYLRSQLTSISFDTLTEKEIEWYLKTGEWQGAIGGYKIDGLGACFVKNINGSYASLVGLPMHELYKILFDSSYSLY